ncbi:MAG: o-succinylbenzoate synthase [Opitutaceae bacterium]
MTCWHARLVDDVALLFAYKVYRRPFRMPVRTSRGLWQAREGILLRIEDECGRAAFGEIAPIEQFGTETLAGALAWCAAIAGRVNADRLAQAPASLPCTAWAVASALAALGTNGADETRESGAGATAAAVNLDRRLAVSALIPRGETALAHVRRCADAGFTTFKLKIGAADFATELREIERIVDALPSGARLRLDANGGLDARGAIRWLDAAQAWPVEFIEQPLPVEARRETIALAHDHRVTLAIDEAARTADDIKRWRDDGWAGVFVIKPALAGRPSDWLAEVAADPGQFVFSSALETAIGLRAGLLQAFESGATRALGYGVGAFFQDDGLGGGVAQPEITAADVAQMDVEKIWRSL